MSKYTIHAEYWERYGHFWEPFANEDIEASSDEDAIGTLDVSMLNLSKDEDYDIRVVVVADENGEKIHEEFFQNSVAKNMQDSMDATWSHPKEFEEKFLGLMKNPYRDQEWYTWTRNGGSKGSFDRTKGNGRWVEHYEQPEEVGVQEAFEWMLRHLGLGAEEAIKEMAEESDLGEHGIVLELGELVIPGLYRVGDIYAYIIDEDEDVTYFRDEEDAMDFVGNLED